MGYCVLAALTVLVTTGSGCATGALVEKARAQAEIRSIGLRVERADAETVEVAWRALVTDLPDLTGVLSIGPVPDDCAAPRVLVAQRFGPPLPVSQQERLFAPDSLPTRLGVEAIWSEAGNPTCTLLLVFRRVRKRDALTVNASWDARSSAPADTIAGPRPDTWLLVFLPATFVVDSVGICLVAPMLICLGNPEMCRAGLSDVVPGADSSPAHSR